MFFCSGAERSDSYQKSGRIPTRIRCTERQRPGGKKSGWGFHLYFQYLEFSPEIRFSHGPDEPVTNPDNSDKRIAGTSVDIRRKSITLYLNFQ